MVLVMVKVLDMDLDLVLLKVVGMEVVLGMPMELALRKGMQT